MEQKEKSIEEIVQFDLTFPTPGDTLPTNGHYFPVNVKIDPQTGQILEFTEDLTITPGGRDPEMFLDAMISLLESFGVYHSYYKKCSLKERFTYRIERGAIVVPKDGLNQAIREQKGPYQDLRIVEGKIHLGWDGQNDCPYESNQR